MRVTDPDGREWRVRRRWVPPDTVLFSPGLIRRWLGVVRDIGFGGAQRAGREVVDDPRGASIWLALPLLAVIALPLVVGLGLLLAAVDAFTFLYSGAPLLVRRLFGRRSWRTEAIADDGTGFAVEADWSAPGEVARVLLASGPGRWLPVASSPRRWV